MNKSSIFYAITFIFVFAIVSVILAFLWLIEYDKQNYTNELNFKYSSIAEYKILNLSGRMSNDEYKERIKNYKIKPITDPKNIRMILLNGEILGQTITTSGLVGIIYFNKENYLKIIHDGFLYLYLDQDYQGHRYFIIKILASGIVCVFVLLYVFIITRLRPLASLKKQIDKFAANKLDEIINVGSGNDEISQVASAFYVAINQINKLNKSRQFFIRNMMHELKTPITKGLITIEMIEENKYKKRLYDIFNRLETLINEFAAIEQVTSGASFINNKKYNILDLIDEAKEMAMNDDNNINIIIKEGFYVNVDFKLFTTAIKNMIDNGIKYSIDNFIQIEINKDYICFKNKGDRLRHKLEYYTQAFTKDSKTKDSFGLGLYIVNTILISHKMKLDYNYENGLNVFYFKDIKEILFEN